MKNSPISGINKLAEMFNLDVCRQMIKDCPNDETVILLPHYSINRPKYDDDGEYWDFIELENYFGCPLIVSDYDDLIADPYGIYES